MLTRLQSLRTRDRVLITALTAYMGFALACGGGDNNDENNGTTNNGTTNNGTTNNGTTNNGTTNNNSGFVFNADIQEDTTWSGTIEVTESVYVYENATLTIEPGTTIKMCSDCFVEIGWSGKAGTLIADGTVDEPIVFEGQVAEQGYWRNIHVADEAASNTSLSFVEIHHAGAGDNGALLLERDVTLDNVEVLEPAGDGIVASDFKVGSKAIQVTGAEDYPVRLTNDDALHHFPDQSGFPDSMTVLDGGKPYIALDFDSLEEDEVTMRDVVTPYMLLDDLYTTAASVFTIEAGVHLVMSADRFMEIGWAGNEGTIKIEGTEEDPVLIEGADPEEGTWKGIFIKDNAKSSSAIKHTTLRHGGGGGNGALSLERDILIDNLTIEQSADLGIKISGAGLADGSKMLTVTGTTGHPVDIHANGLGTLPADGSFAGNDNDTILVTDGSIETDMTVAKVNVPYEIKDAIYTTGTAEITISPGVEILFQADTFMEIGWAGNEGTLIAEGTMAEPINFTSTDETKGYWQGIRIKDDARSGTSFKYVNFNWGGRSDNANLILERPVPVENCSFSNSAGYGLKINYRDAQMPPIDYVTSNTFTDNNQGDIDDRRE